MQPWAGHHLPATAHPEVAPEAFVVALPLTEKALRSARRWLMGAGVLAILGGVAAIIVPAVASVAITTFLGWMLVVGALVLAMHAAPLRSRGLTRMVGALLTLVVGVWLIAFPLSATIGLTFLLAWWFFGSGVLLLYEAWWLRDIPGVAPPIVIHGVLSLVLGVLLLLDLPSSANWALGVLVGVNLLLWGARALAAARALDRALKTP